jgi:predicted DNA-binding protein
VLETAQETPKEFDPRPFIRLYEGSIDRLNQLGAQLAQHIAFLEDEDARTEAMQRDRSIALEHDFGELQGAFEELESNITEVGATAIRVGEQLETLDKQKMRGAEARDLIRYFLEFAESKKGGQAERLEELRSRGGEGQFKAAVITRRLNSIAKDVELPETSSAKERIERYCEHLEQGLLHEFAEAYQAGDIEHVTACLPLDI